MEVCTCDEEGMKRTKKKKKVRVYIHEKLRERIVRRNTIPLVIIIVNFYIYY